MNREKKILFVLLSLMLLLGSFGIINIKINPIKTIEDPKTSGFGDLLGNYYDGGYAYDVAVSGSIAYVADGSDGLEIIATQDPTNPHELGQFPNGIGLTEEVWISNEIAFLLDTWWGLVIVNVSDPSNPIEIGRQEGTFHSDLFIKDDFAYIVGRPFVQQGETQPIQYFQVVDISDLSNPTIVADLKSTPPYHWGEAICIENDIAFVAGDCLHIINISNPFDPQVLNIYQTMEGYEDGRSLLFSFNLIN